MNTNTNPRPQGRECRGVEPIVCTDVRCEDATNHDDGRAASRRDERAAINTNERSRRRRIPQRTRSTRYNVRGVRGKQRPYIVSRNIKNWSQFSTRRRKSHYIDLEKKMEQRFQEKHLITERLAIYTEKPTKKAKMGEWPQVNENLCTLPC